MQNRTEDRRRDCASKIIQRSANKIFYTVANILECVHGNVKTYVEAICFVIARTGSKRTTAICPGLESLPLESERANVVMR